MKKNTFLSLVTFLSIQASVWAQNAPYQNYETTPEAPFWQNVRFGGGLGLAFGDGFANVSVAPSAIYNFSDQLSAGVGLQYNYVKSKDYFDSHSYGVSFLGLFNPIPELQLSAELEQLRVNNQVYYYDYRNQVYQISDDFWNTALFLGAGYSSGNATVGIRYNVLFNKNNHVYEQAWMPFVRVYF